MIEINQLEDQMCTVLHWSHQKEPKQAKIKDEVIRRKLAMILILPATPLPSNPPRLSQVSLIKKKLIITINQKHQEESRSKKN